ncbi:UNVERIFIED_CONTAM: hypothetical protein HDU68_006969 [Siphonaria sp. JEL0065]|nr:hypothetical protein HDU68_006969 [Siphonaria sp. JEL0065]
MFYGLGEGVARLLVFKLWGIENFTTIPTAGVTSTTAAKLAESEKKGLFGGLFGGNKEVVLNFDHVELGVAHAAFAKKNDKDEKENEDEDAGLFVNAGGDQGLRCVVLHKHHLNIFSSTRELSLKRIA